MKHQIFYDDTCPLCLRSVAKIRSWDHKHQFLFAPIESQKAKDDLKDDWQKFKDANTLILVEHCPTAPPRIWIKGRAVMRIFWLIGGWRKLIGWLAFIPLGVDSLYAFIAKRRHRF